VLVLRLRYLQSSCKFPACIAAVSSYGAHESTGVPVISAAAQKSASSDAMRIIQSSNLGVKTGP